MTIIRRRLALIAGAALLAGGAGSGIAMATTVTAAPVTTPAAAVRHDTPDPGENSTGPDRDNIQQGDQNARDRGTNGEGQEQQRAGEASEGVSDGPGGHADANSSVDHRFTGKE
ncbi:hypothetical protein ABZ934_24560 [Streptomyces sp. NPDC046557]|uniref:hypothetical protein n=1 Tax=Streptomyces sp. NPDC046557 TaxID=3155372 RepID=UPI0033CB0966